MSVFVWTESEIGALAGALGAEQPTLQAALILATANRAAFALSYYVGRAGEHEDWDQHSWANIAPLQLDNTHIDPDAPLPSGASDYRDWARNLLYNCISNAGVDFAPAGAAQVLMDAARRKDAQPHTAASVDALCAAAQAKLRQLKELEAADVFVAASQMRKAAREVEEHQALARFVPGSQAYRDECERTARLCNMSAEDGR